MKKIFSFYLKTPLVVRIIIGLIIGVILGLYLPNAEFIKILGDIFVGLLKSIAPILVFVLVISSLANAGSGIGKRFSSVIMYYIASTFIAACIATLASFIFKIKIPLVESEISQIPPSSLVEIFKNLIGNMIENPVVALSKGNYIGILTWSIILGVMLKKVATVETKTVMQDISNSVSKAIAFVIELAPLGILGLVFASVNEYGLKIFADYGRLVLLLIGCMLFVAFFASLSLMCIRMTEKRKELSKKVSWKATVFHY